MADLIFDDFSGTSLDPAWTRRNVVSGDETWLSPGLAVADVTAGDMYLRPAPAGTAWTVEISFSKSSGVAFMVGPVILGATGAGVGTTFYYNPVGYLFTTITGYTYGGSFTNDDTSQNLVTSVRYRIRRDGSSYYTSYSDDDGASYTTESAAHVNATTVTQVGFGCWLESLTAPSITVEEFKVFDASVIPDVTVTPPTATATATAHAPAVTATSDVTITAPAATATAQAHTPAVTVTGDITITAPTATATAQAHAPTVTTERNVTVTAPTATGTATAYAPTVTIAGDVVIVAPPATSTAQAHAPAAVGQFASVTIEPPAATAYAWADAPTLDYDPPLATPPATYTPAVRVEKAIAYPQPILVNGRAT